VLREECIQGRFISGEEVQWLRHWILERCSWSRKRLARGLCEIWNWRDGRGRLKDFAARSFLLKLEARGRIVLPALQEQKRRPPRVVQRPTDWPQPPKLVAALAEVRPVRLQRVEVGSALGQRWGLYLQHHHYLGLHRVGQNMGYLAQDSQGRDLGCLLFGAPAWRCAPRDRFLCWSEAERRRGLATVANNTRFLILPWVHVPCLASHLFGLVTRQINGDWRERYGQGLEWLESFVERDRFAGTCYRAANWQWVGQTSGRSRQDREHRLRVSIKDVYLYRLRP
jgi:Domain of unknown function (DUF4338)